jgi:hypothetical protein
MSMNEKMLLNRKIEGGVSALKKLKIGAQFSCALTFFLLLSNLTEKVFKS